MIFLFTLFINRLIMFDFLYKSSNKYLNNSYFNNNIPFNNNITFNNNNITFNNNNNSFINKYQNNKYINNVKKDISILINQNNILEKKNIYLINQINNLTLELNILKDNNLKLKNFITQNINNIEYARAIPVINNNHIDNNIILYIESLKTDNDYLNKQNILLKCNSNT